jgi:hypothetical protein
MSQNPIVEETKHKLAELEQKIRAAKESMEANDAIAEDARKDWQNMLQTHADIRRKLDAADEQGPEVLEGIQFAIDILRNSFERWMARVGGNFVNDTANKDETS